MNNNQHDYRLFSTAARRNRKPIFEVLKKFLPETGLVLEVASGTGEHGAYFAPRFPKLTWQPSDPNPEMRRSIQAWSRIEATKMNQSIDLDVQKKPWPIKKASAVVCINLIHISPWRACLGLMEGAGKILEEGGVLYLYGPYKIKNRHYAQSNIAFDQSLKQQNEEWGVRDLDDVIKIASDFGLRFSQTLKMPKNNLSVIFTKGN